MALLGWGKYWYENMRGLKQGSMSSSNNEGVSVSLVKLLSLLSLISPAKLWGCATGQHRNTALSEKIKNQAFSQPNQFPDFLSLYNHNIVPAFLRRKETARDSYLRTKFLLTNDITSFHTWKNTSTCLTRFYSERYLPLMFIPIIAFGNILVCLHSRFLHNSSAYLVFNCNIHVHDIEKQKQN